MKQLKLYRMKHHLLHPISMKSLLFLCISCCLSCVVVAQEIRDSLTRKTISLQEVEVCDQHAKKSNDAFSFYQSNKLSSTDEILNRMQGLNLIRRGPYGLEPSLRAFQPNQVNVMIDGMKIQGACTDKMDPASIYIEPVNLGSISTAQGASGSTMGSNVGGLINLGLKEPVFMHCKRPMIGVSQSYNSVNTGFQGSASVNHEMGKTAFRISGAYRHAQNYVAGGQSVIPFSQYEKYNASFSAIHAWNIQHQLKVDLLGDIGLNTGFPALTMDVKVAKAGIVACTYRYKKPSWHLFTSETKCYINRVHHEMDDTHRPYVPMHMDMPGNSFTKGMYHQNHIELRKHALDARFDFTQIKTDASMTMYLPGNPSMFMETLPLNTLTTTGFSLSDDWFMKRSSWLQSRFRFDYTSQQMNSTVGINQFRIFGNDLTSATVYMPFSLSTAWNIQLASSSILRTQIAYAQRAPSANERFGYYLYNRFDNYDYIGSPNLKKERSLQFESSYQFQTKHVQFQMAMYYNHQYDYIIGLRIDSTFSPITYGAKGVKTYANIPYSFMAGLDAFIQYQHNRWSYTNSLKYAYTEDYAGHPLPLTAPFKSIQAFRFKPGKWLFQLEYEWASAQYRNNILSGEKQTPAYQLVHLRTGRNISYRSTNMQLGFALENIFDINYRDHLDWGTIPRQGRNLQVSVSFYFQ